MPQTELMIYGNIGQDWWSGDGITEMHVLEGMKELDPTAKDHYIRINSPGGQVNVGLTIMNLLLSHSAQMKVANPDFKLHTVCDGYAMSIASVIFMAGDVRTMALGSVGMIHDAWNGCYGNATEMRKTADTLDMLSSNIADVYANRCVASADKDTPRDTSFFRDLMKAETYMTGDEMVKKGLATELDTSVTAVLDASLTPEIMKGRYVEVMTAGYKKRTFNKPTAAKSILDAKMAKQRLQLLIATLS